MKAKAHEPGVKENLHLRECENVVAMLTFAGKTFFFFFKPVRESISAI